MFAKGIADMFKKSGKQKEELAEAAQVSWRYVHDIDRQRLNPNYSVLERILRALDSNTILLLEKLESSGLIDTQTVNLPSSVVQRKIQFEKDRMDSKFMGERILKIWEILTSVASKTSTE